MTVGQESEIDMFLETLAQAEARTAAKQWDEAALLWEKVVKANPVEGKFWNRLATAFYNTKNFRKAIPAYEKAIELGYGNPANNAYNIASGYALLGEKERAFRWIERAFQMGFLDLEHARKDPDLQILHTDLRFQKLVGITDANKTSRVEGWRSDLEFLVREVKRRRYGTFTAQAEKEFDADVQKLFDTIPGKTDEQINVGIMKLMVKIGDGHSGFLGMRDTRAEPPLTLPLKFYLFEEGLFIIAADPKYADLLGSQVLRFENSTIDEVVRKLDPVISRDNAIWIREVAPYRMRFLSLMHALGLISGPKKASLAVRTMDGKERVVTVEGNREHTIIWNTQPNPSPWINFPKTRPLPLPHYLKNVGTKYWFEYLPESRTAYFQFNQIRNDSLEPLAAFSDRLFKFINENAVEKLVIDLRWNNGGNTMLLRPLIHGLIKTEKINQRGKLFVIIGRRTFSAAQNAATFIERDTNAIFVGEPTGASPNFVGEEEPFVLPFSKILVNVSHVFHQSSSPFDKRDVDRTARLPTADIQGLSRKSRPGFRSNLELRRETDQRMTMAGFMSKICSLLLLLSCAFPSAAAGQLHAPRVFAITGVTVIPMDSERVIANQTVVITDGKITAMGSTGRIRPRKNAEVIDGGGKFLIPGLFDMHIHIEPGRETSLVLYLASGVTTVRNMHGSPWHMKLRERIGKGEVIGPRLFTTGPTTFSARLANTPEAAEKFVADQKNAGYDSIKMYGTRPGYAMSKETYHRLLVTARKLNMRVVGHTPRGLPFQAVLDEGQASVDHAEEIYYVYQPILERMGPIADFQFGKISLEEYRKLGARFPDLQTEILPLLKKLARDVKRSALVFTPGLFTYETIWRQITAEYPEMLADARMRYVYPLQRLYAGPGFNSYQGRWSDRLDEMRTLHKYLVELQKMMVTEFYKAGVPMMAGTDATLPFVIEGFSLHDELQRLVDAGFTPYDALKSATFTPAEFLNIDDKLGTVAVGKIADLVLLDGNPLEDIRNTQKISGVFANGQWFSKARIARSLENLASSYEPFWIVIQDSQKYFSKGDFRGALEEYKRLANKTDEIAGYFESTVNFQGYSFLRQKNLEKAEELFKLNSVYFPRSANAWDSLAEVYVFKGDKARAIEYYKRSLELNPNNNNAVEQIKKLETQR